MALEHIFIFFSGILLGALLAIFWALRFFNKHKSDLILAQDQLKASFTALSQEALMNNIDFMYKANEQERNLTQQNLQNIIAPLKESLVAVDKKVIELENARHHVFGSLKEQIEGLLKSQNILHKETQTLARSLNAPSIKGRWGEMQLRRVVELSGLSAHCDFIEQASIKNDEDLGRPDMIITLPAKKLIIVDAKVPLEIFSDINSQDQTQVLAASLRRHIQILKKKNYYKITGQSPEFTVMFLPGEAFLHRALSADAMLLDFAAEHDIIISTPITLIALLKAVAFGFKQEAVATNIEEVRRLSQQLIDRIGKVGEHFDKLGRHLKQATDSYNQTLSSLDSRVMVTARKLAEIKSVSSQSLESPNLAFVDIIPKPVTLGSPEFEDKGQ